MRRAELAEPAGEREREPRDEPAPGERENDAEERARRPGAERAGRCRQVRVGRLEGRDRLAHVERARDVRDGEGHAQLREGDRQPEEVERPAEQARAPERGEQADARDGRRQDEWQLDEHDRERASAEARLARR